MKHKISILIFVFALSSFAFAKQIKFSAELYPLDKIQDKPESILTITEDYKDDKIFVIGEFKKGEIVLLGEKATLDEKTAEIIEYAIDDRQHKETGLVTVSAKEVMIKYSKEGGKEIIKSFPKPKHLVAPGNFDHYLEKNFSMIKEKKSMVVDFLVWSEHKTYKFKITYLGLEDLNGQKAHVFKMNLKNPLIAAFISPIKIWYSEDMKNILLYKGRVAVMRGESPNLKNFDAEVKYNHGLNAP